MRRWDLVEVGPPEVAYGETFRAQYGHDVVATYTAIVSWSTQAKPPAWVVTETRQRIPITVVLELATAAVTEEDRRVASEMGFMAPSGAMSIRWERLREEAPAGSVVEYAVQQELIRADGDATALHGLVFTLGADMHLEKLPIRATVEV